MESEKEQINIAIVRIKASIKYCPRITQRVRKISILFQKKIDSSSMNDYPCPPERKEIPSLYTKQHFHCRHNNLCIYIYKCVLCSCVFLLRHKRPPNKQNGNAHLPSSNVSPGTSASRVSTGATANRIVRIRATKIALTKPLHTPLHLSVRSVFTLFIYFFFFFYPQICSINGSVKKLISLYACVYSSKE